MGSDRARLCELAHAFLLECEHTDDRVALGAFGELRSIVDELSLQLVEDARSHRLTWGEIARWSGFATRQAAHASYCRRSSVRRLL